MRPNECKWCGLPLMDDTTESTHDDVFACGSSYRSVEMWNQSIGCVEITTQRDRIRRALETLKNATRFELVRDEHGCYMKGRDSWGNWLDVIEIEKAMQILEGENNDTD